MSVKYKQYEANRKNGWKNDAKNADENIKYCTSCERCYELVDKHFSYAYNLVYLDDFPTYKKERRKCEYCVKGEKENDVVS